MPRYDPFIEINLRWSQWEVIAAALEYAEKAMHKDPDMAAFHDYFGLSKLAGIIEDYYPDDPVEKVVLDPLWVVGLGESDAAQD